MSDLIAFTDDDSTGTLNQSVLDSIITAASGYIDRKVANIYGSQLPFNPVPSSVASMAMTITCWMLYRRALSNGETNNFQDDYNNVTEFLDKVNVGEMHLNDVPTRDFQQGAVVGRPVIFSGGVFGTGCLSSTM